MDAWSTCCWVVVLAAPAAAQDSLEAVLAATKSGDVAVRRKAYGDLVQLQVDGEKQARALVAGLRDEDPGLREQVATLLLRADPAQLRALRVAVRWPDPEARLRAELLLATVDRTLRLPQDHWSRGLASSEPWLRACAARLTMRVHGLSDLGVLLTAGRDPDVGVRVAAARRLASTRIRDPELAAGALELARRLVASERRDERQAGLSLADGLGPAAIDLYVDVLGQKDHEHAWAITRLASLRHDASFHRIAAMARADGGLARAFRSALPRYGITRTDPRAEAVLEAFRAADLSRDLEALRALSEIDPKLAEKFVPELLKLLASDPAPATWIACTVALSRIGQPAKAAVPLLIAALDRPELRAHRWRAVQALGRFGALAEPAFDRLLALGDPSLGRLASESLLALADIARAVGGKRVDQVAEILVAIPRDPRKQKLRVPAGRAFARLGKAIHERLPYLVIANDSKLTVFLQAALETVAREDARFMQKLLASESSRVRVAALRAVGRLGSEALVFRPRVLEILAAQGKPVRVARFGRVDLTEARLALEALAATGSVPGTEAPRLIALLEAEAGLEARVHSCLRVMDPPPTALLVEALQAEGANRRLVLAAIGALGQRGADAIPAIVEAAEMWTEQNFPVFAARALAKLGEEGCRAALKLGIPARHLRPSIDALARSRNADSRLMATKLLSRKKKE